MTQRFPLAAAALLTLVALLLAPALHAQSLEFDAAASALIPNVRDASVAWGDYTGDGALDLVVTGQDNSGNLYGLVYRNDGAGGLELDEAASAVVAGVTQGSVAWGDYTGDGALDLIVTGRSTSFVGSGVGLLYRNDGVGGLTLDAEASAVVADVSGSSVAWGDYTGDGALDLVVTGTDNSYYGLRVGLVYRNDGAGGLTLDEAASAVVDGVRSGSVAWGDYTGDGALDLVVTGLGASAYVGSVYRNNGAGELALDAEASAVVADVSGSSVAWGDYTGDGALDLAVIGRGRGGSVGSLYRNVNTAPIANAGPDQTVIAGQTVTLDGSASTDPDDDALTFAWTLASAALSGADTASPMFCAGTVGAYTAELVVSDGTVDSDSDDVTVTALSVDDAIAGLIADIEGALSPRYARALTGRLTKARSLLARGRSASSMFRTVRTRIGTYVRIGTLTQAQADELTGSLDAITGVLASPCTDTAAIQGDDALASATIQAEVSFGLAAPYPNPTSGRATVAFELADATDVRLAVYDALGREVAVLLEGSVPAGRHELAMDASAMTSGTYLVRLFTADGRTAMHRLTLLR